MRFWFSARLIIGLSASTAAAFAQDNDGCNQFSWPVSKELAAFSSPDLSKVQTNASADSFTEAFALQLARPAQVLFVVAPEGKPKPGDSFAGVFTLTLTHAGIYQVTTSGEGWVDAVQNGKAAVSLAHSGRHDCGAVRKSVRFALQAGSLTLQISGASADKIKVAVVPVD